MQIFLEELSHQRKVLDALLKAMPRLCDKQAADDTIYANPLLQYAGDERCFIDVKMETGTGKTYVYTRAMFELHQQFGLFKFIIIVPSLAIKEGTKNFIDSAYARQHFSRFFPNKKMDLHCLKAGDFQGKKGRKTIPAALMQFHDATRNDFNVIQCLLLSDKGFLDREDSALFKNEYEQNFFGGANCPAAALCETRPIVMIDEPHRIKRDGRTYKNIMAHLKPQIILRFGATFPEFTEGKGKNKRQKKDYYRGNPIYDLDGVAAFNQDLVKGVEVQFPDLPENARGIFKVKKVSQKELVLTRGNKNWSIKAGEELSEAGQGFEGGICYEGGKKLSNALELHEGMELAEGIFANSYQEILLSLALQAHFDTEAENFLRHERGEGFKVKTNALFFMDSIESYRKPEGWLRSCFERLLRERLAAQLKQYPDGEYHEFLQASLQNLAQTHGGYFAKDWGEKDDSGAVAAEVQDILHKERSLPFKKADGSWNIRRFFFSKWTLREGWDNPNVFTICKLRSSGSETSKVQEVGRGLRLPVDEKGNRLSGGQWLLNFIIGWDEKDFARKLAGEINRDASVPLNREKLTENMLAVLCEMSGQEEAALLNLLGKQDIIDYSRNFKAGGYEDLLRLYPQLRQNSLKDGKISIKGEAPQKVKLRRENWHKIKELWRQIAKSHMVVFERLGADKIEQLFAEILQDEAHFKDNARLGVNRQKLKKGYALSLTESRDSAENSEALGMMPYSAFVEKLARQTAIPIQVIHRSLWARLRAFGAAGLSKEQIDAKLNQNSCNAVIERWRQKFAEVFSTQYYYDALDFMANLSVWKKGDFVESIAAGEVGRIKAEDVADDARNLYEPPFYYDSETEHEIEKIKTADCISIFGKIPRRAIRVPLYTGGSTTPDFMYAAERDGNIIFTAFVEAKAENMREEESRAVAVQEKFFQQIVNNITWKLVKSADEAEKFLADIIMLRRA